MTTERKQADVKDRRGYPRLKASFNARFGVCGGHGREIPGFTGNLSLSGLALITPDTNAKKGDHVAVEIAVPGYDQPLYFLGEVLRVTEGAAGFEVAVRFDWLGKSDQYREKLQKLLEAHGL